MKDPGYRALDRERVIRDIRRAATAPDTPDRLARTAKLPFRDAEPAP